LEDDVLLHTGAAYVSIERMTNLWRVNLLQRVNVESRARRGKRWSRDVACMGQRRNAHMVLAENPVEKKGHLEKVGVDGKITVQYR
jgi:hypothetical protein